MTDDLQETVSKGQTYHEPMTVTDGDSEKTRQYPRLGRGKKVRFTNKVSSYFFGSLNGFRYVNLRLSLDFNVKKT